MTAAMREAAAKVADRFWSKVDRSDENACWEWIACRNSRGYGSFSLNGRSEKAHRISYRLSKGEIPEGMVVCHKCDNPPCCNPGHLFVGTHADNNRDKTAKGRNVRPMRDESSVNYVRGSASNFSKLDEDEVRSIRARRAAGEKTKHLAREFGVDRTLIWQISARKVWSHVA